MQGIWQAGASSFQHQPTSNHRQNLTTYENYSRYHILSLAVFGSAKIEPVWQFEVLNLEPCCSSKALFWSILPLLKNGEIQIFRSHAPCLGGIPSIGGESHGPTAAFVVALHEIPAFSGHTCGPPQKLSSFWEGMEPLKLWTRANSRDSWWRIQFAETPRSQWPWKETSDCSWPHEQLQGLFWGRKTRLGPEVPGLQSSGSLHEPWRALGPQ